MVAETRPTFATLAIGLMAVGGVGTIALGVVILASGSAVFGGANLLGVILMFLLGGIYAYGSWALVRGESWGWGAGTFGGLLYVVLGVFLNLAMIAFVAIAVAVMVLLLRSREYYGMIREDSDEIERKRKELESQRTANPDRVACPKCGSVRLWISTDRSAFCLDCKAGTVSAPAGRGELS